MPDLPLQIDKNIYINFMRAHKKYNPYFETLSRKEYYPIASVEYKKYKKFYEKHYTPSKKNMIASLKAYFNL